MRSERMLDIIRGNDVVAMLFVEGQLIVGGSPFPVAEIYANTSGPTPVLALKQGDLAG